MKKKFRSADEMKKKFPKKYYKINGYIEFALSMLMIMMTVWTLKFNITSISNSLNWMLFVPFFFPFFFYFALLLSFSLSLWPFVCDFGCVCVCESVRHFNAHSLVIENERFGGFISIIINKMHF